MKWVILILGIASNASASVLIKMAMMPPRIFPTISNLFSILENWPFLLGLGLYGLAFLLYSASLTHLPLNIAHPILTSGAVATVALFSVLIFGEPFHWTTGIGIIFVLTGVVMITLKVA